MRCRDGPGHFEGRMSDETENSDNGGRRCRSQNHLEV